MDPGSNHSSGLTQSRKEIINSVSTVLASAPESAQWNQLVIKDGSGNVLRIASPGKAMAASPPVFDDNYLDNSTAYGYSYINDIWSSLTSFYRSNPLKLQIPSGSIYTGVINADNTITFTTSPPTHTVVFAAPSAPTPPTQTSTSYIIFGGQVPPNTPKNASLVLSHTPGGEADAIQLCKLFEEGVIAAIMPTSSTIDALTLASFRPYYQVNTNLSPVGQSGGPWFSLYSKALHAIGAGLIYTFAFDDALWPEVQIHQNVQTPTNFLSITIGDVQP